MSSKIITFGCRLNTYESELLKQELGKINSENDLILFNSCAVTNEAERQLRQAIRRARRENPKSKIIITGCASQIYPEKYAMMDEVDFVIGNKEKSELVKSIENFLNKQIPEKVKVSNIQKNSNYFLNFDLLSNFEGRSRAFIQIQNGCNHHCTYCIIPYGRGKSCSLDPSKVVEGIKKFCDNGYNEVVLTGVDITEYGNDLGKDLNLGKLITLILKKVSELKRLRLSSIDVGEIDNELLELIYYEKRLMPHIHISLQSGDNIILKRMLRRHTREDVIKFCRETQEKRKGIAFGCDIIAGFPTETEEMFHNSLKIIEEANLIYTHVFPYSIRPGTPAGKMLQIGDSTKKVRAKLLRQAGKKQLDKFLQKMVGTKQSVLIERGNIGRAENFAVVDLESTASNKRVGEIVEIEITGKMCKGSVIR